MYRRILVPLDGSEAAEHALTVARAVASEGAGGDGTAELHLVHVLEDFPDFSLKLPQADMEWEEKGSEMASEYLESLAAEARDAGIDDVSSSVVQGRIAEALERYRRDHRIDLVVMTTHGEGGFRRWWLGSVADELVRRVPVPLLLLRPWNEEGELDPVEPDFREILIPLDGSEDAEAVLDHAREFARGNDARITLLQVVRSGRGLDRFRRDPGDSLAPAVEDARTEALAYLDAVATKLEAARESVPATTIDTRAVASGRTAEAILEAAREEGADLVALATHGRGGFTRMVIGSVADKVLRGSRTPALVVRVSPEE